MKKNLLKIVSATFVFATIAVLTLLSVFTPEALAQGWAPSITAPTISGDNYYRWSWTGISKGIPVTVAANSKVTLTNLVFDVYPGQSLGFFSKITAGTNGTYALMLDVSSRTAAENTDWSYNQPLTITMNQATTSVTQPIVSYSGLNSTNLLAIRSIRITYLTNISAVALVPSNIVVTVFKPLAGY